MLQQRCGPCELKCDCIGYAYSIACARVSAHNNDAITFQDSNMCTTGHSKIRSYFFQCLALNVAPHSMNCPAAVWIGLLLCEIVGSRLG